jgi:hypothetical protein
VQKESSLNIFPNPGFEGTFYLKSESPIQYYGIYSLGGKLVQSKKVYSIQNGIHINLVKGVYIVHATNHNNKILLGKVEIL